jgi:hypothetical protein
MDFKEYIKHVSIVILGILIAFWVNNLGVSYKENNNREQILKSILKEQKDNHNNVQESIKELSKLYLMLDSVNRNLKDKINIEYSYVNLTSIGYESLKYSGAMKDMKYSIVSSVVGVYGTHQVITNLENRALSELLRLKQKSKQNGKEIEFILLHLKLLKANLVSLLEEQEKLIGILNQKFD